MILKTIAVKIKFRPQRSGLFFHRLNNTIILDNVKVNVQVYSVAFSHTGERYASGSQDRSVIIWSEQHEGLLKYRFSTHVC